MTVKGDLDNLAGSVVEKMRDGIGCEGGVDAGRSRSLDDKVHHRQKMTSRGHGCHGARMLSFLSLKGMTHEPSTDQSSFLSADDDHDDVQKAERLANQMPSHGTERGGARQTTAMGKGTTRAGH